MIIGIEGPAGAGKTTMARTVAAETGTVVIEGGAWYRALTYLAQREHLDLTNTTTMIGLAKNLQLKHVNEGGKTHYYIDSDDITDAMYSGKVNQSVAVVAAQLPVRAVVDALIIKEVRAHSNVITIGHHLKRALPEAAVLQVGISDSEAEKRHTQRAGRHAQAVGNRNAADTAIAKMLQTDKTDVTEIDVTDLSADEQAEILRQFIQDAQKNSLSSKIS